MNNKTHMVYHSLSKSRLVTSFLSLPLAVLLISLSLIAPDTQAQDEWKINLKNADIREFATQVSMSTGKSFIIDPRVKGNVTVISTARMDADAIYELFLSVLRVHGYAAVPTGPKGQVIKIVQQVLAKQSGNPNDFNAITGSEELITTVIPVKNSPSIELVKILRPLIPQYGHIAGLAKPNALIISDHAANIKRLTAIVAKIDVADQRTSKIINLKEAWVEDMVGLLERLAPDQIGKGAKGPNKVTIVASERTNSLVVKGDPDSIKVIEDLVTSLDIPANSSGTIQVVRLAHSDATELADILKNIVSDNESGVKGGGNVKTSIQADPALNALVIRANPSTMMELKEIIASLDVRRLQVLIEAAIIEVTDDYQRDLGTELTFADAGATTFPAFSTSPSGTLSSIITAIAASDGGTPTIPSLGTAPLLIGGKVSETGSSFGFLIRALEKDDRTELLSTPSITTMDNEEARIVVGENVPFRTGSTTTGSNGATNPFTTIERKDVGLTLEVTPHVHDGNLIRLEIKQEVSEVNTASGVSIGADGSADLITLKREIQTTVLAENGEVIVLGGLIRNKTTILETGVPLLKDIPFLGALFKTTSKKKEKKNLMVFIRPTVIGTRASAAEVTKRQFLRVWEVEIEGTDPLARLHELIDGKQ